MVGLTRTQRDTDLIRYASMLARLDTAVELRFVHVLSKGAADDGSPGHDVVQKEIERQVATSFLNIDATNQVRSNCPDRTL